MTTSTSCVFNSEKVTVIYVLGGPGAGKGTQCERLVKEFGFTHLSAGDLLRAEQNRPGSELGTLIKDYIVNGKIVPMEITIKLLENAMRESMQKSNNVDPNTCSDDQLSGRFLIDGFPRKMDQAIKFDESVLPASLVLYLVCPEEILLQRLLERGKTSGRDDDNEESIRKRFRTFIETSMPVIDYYDTGNKVLKVDSTKSIDQVYSEIVASLKPVLESKKN